MEGHYGPAPESRSQEGIDSGFRRNDGKLAKHIDSGFRRNDGQLTKRIDSGFRRNDGQATIGLIWSELS